MLISCKSNVLFVIKKNAPWEYIFVLFLLLYLWLPISTYGQPPKLKELKGDKLEGNILPAEKKGVWGYIDEKGSFFIKPVFEKAFPFVNGYVRSETILDGIDQIQVDTDKSMFRFCFIRL